MKQKPETQTANEPEATPPKSRFAILDAATPVKDLDGLYAAGEVTGRRRTSFTQKAGEATRYNIAVTLMSPTGKLTIERWSDSPAPPDIPRVGDHVCIPITLQHFNTKTGTGTRLCWGSTDRGEEF